MNTQIIRLNGDRKGLLARVKTMDKANYYHIQSNEMTPYQRRIHRKLTEKEQRGV